jgi:uncharacterized protein YqeY
VSRSDASVPTESAEIANAVARAPENVSRVSDDKMVDVLKRALKRRRSSPFQRS